MPDMTPADMEATLVLHEIFLAALAQSHPDPAKLRYEFAQIYGPTVKNLRAGLKAETEVTKRFQEVFQRLERRIPKG